MSVILPRWWFLWLMALWLVGCSIFPRAAPPIYYQLEYQPPLAQCRQGFKKGVRVWKFTASSPYGRTEMVVLKPNGHVSFSSAFQWVASPGTLVSENLLHDLTSSRLFPQVVSANDPTMAPLELSGRVFVFAWERTGAVSWAVLQVEVSLIDTDKPRRVILRREYDFRSQPLAEDTSYAFARAMSELMSNFSEKFQEDLCTAIGSHPKLSRPP
ncbi:MAG: ABC-type transport auxiliary lipoprotein family protein [Syntrophobacterales bacterium]